jgi:signal transduction histidine kinase
MSQAHTEMVFVDALENIASTVTKVLGFEMAAISIALDDQDLEMIAVAGCPQAHQRLLGRRTPISKIEQELACAEVWGNFRFLAHERLIVAEDQLGWVPDIDVPQDPAMWHPLDLLLAPIYDDDRRLRGLLSVDLPLDRRRPNAAKRDELQRYAEQTRRAVLTALERSELAEQVRMAEAAREIVREASSERSIDRILEVCHPALTAAFNAVGMWIQTFDKDDLGTDVLYGSSEGDISTMPEGLRRLGRMAADQLWGRREVAVVTDTIVPPLHDLSPGQEQQVYDYMATRQTASMLFVPLGAGRECLGSLGLTRRVGTRAWNTIERQAALDIGRDLGRALLNARTFESKRRLVEELRELARYKSRLIATISHELKNPLTAILGHTEMLSSVPDLEPDVSISIGSMERAAMRMQQLIDDLLVLAQAGDPRTEFRPVPVALDVLVHEALELLATKTQRKQLKVVVEFPDEPILVLGEEQGLARLCANLISNAVKYTPDQGAVTISLERTPTHVELSVSDTGMGISQTDQTRMFEEFFRSTNPDAVAQPGTGLGLTIVQRIVERHDGTIRLDSTLGVGSSFTVTLNPAT